MTDQLADESALDAPDENRTPTVGGVHRYPGSPPFGDSELDRLLFRGRDKEVDEILHSVLSYDLFLIYAVSGMGKTSILTAGVLEPLRERDFFPVIVRLNRPGTSPVELVDAQVRETGAASGIDVTRSPVESRTNGEPATLWDLLGGLEVWRGNTLLQLVIVFDQFEELFTLGWSDDERTQFIAQFGEIVRRHRIAPAHGQEQETGLPAPRVKFVLLMREDFLGQLEALAVHVPQIMHRRFRLDGLSPDQAEAAVREPARLVDPRLSRPRFVYRDEAVDAILGFLRTKEEHGTEVQTSTVDPSQLQIICQHIERSIVPQKEAPPDGLVEITEDDLGGRDGLERIVGDFYRRVLETFPHAQRQALRGLCERGLISHGGRRLSVEEGELCSDFGVSKEVLHALVDQRLLRSEPRVGSVYYELAHDSLTGPILAYRDERIRARDRRRRRILLVAAAVVGVALFGLVLARAARGDGSAVSVEELRVGQPLERQLDSAGDLAVFEFNTTNDDLLVVEVDPEPTLGLGLEVTSADEAAEAPSISQFDPNSAASGADAVAVVGGQEGRYRATVRGASAGTFQIEARPIAASSIEVPGAASAQLTAGGLAVFELDVTDDRPFIVTASPDAQLDVVVAVIDPKGVTTERNRAAKSAPESAVDGGVTGRYWIVVGSLESTRGSFGLTVEPAEVEPLGIGEERTGQSSGPFSLYQLNVQGPQPFIVTMSSPEQAVYLELIEPDGTHATAHFDNMGSRQYAVASGTPGGYLAVIDGPPSSTFEISAAPVDAVAMEIGDSAAGELADAGAMAVFTFDAVAETSLVVNVAPTSGDLDPVLAVGGPDDEALSSDNYGAGKPETVWIDDVTDGRYQVIVTGSGDGPTGPFEVSVRPTEAAEFAVGATVSSAVDADGPLAVFEFEAPDPGLLTVQLGASSGLDAVLAVMDPSGATSTADAGAEGAAEAVVVEGGLDGRYRVLVEPFDDTSGAFELSVRRTEPASVGSGETADGSLASGEMTVFEVSAPAGELITVAVEPEPGFEVDLEITGPDGGTTRAPYTDAAGRRVAFIQEPAPATYRAVVRAIDSAGRFGLSVQPGETVELEPGVEGTGTLSGDDPFVAFEFDLAENKSSVVRVTPGSQLDAAVAVSGPTTATSLADSHLVGGEETVLVDAAAGRHLAVVSAIEGHGTFSIALDSFEAGQVPVVEEESFAITEPGGVTVAEFDVGVEGRPLVVSVVGSDGLTPTLDVFSSAGSPIGSPLEYDSLASAVVVPYETGRHRAIVSGANGSVGQFELTVRAVEIRELVPGDVVEGVIARPGDLAVFHLENPRGNTVGVEVRPDPSVDAIVHVTGADRAATTIDAGAGGHAETFEVDGLGPFEISVTASSPGAFGLSVSDLPS
jgi:hypothetical protein